MVGRCLGIAIEPGIVRAAALSGERVRWAASAMWTDNEDLVQAMGSLAAERPAGFARVVVAVGGSALQFKIVDGLPKLRPAELREHVRVSCARYFVRTVATLECDATAFDSPGGAAVLAAIDADLALAIARGARAAGLRLVDLVPSPIAMKPVLFGRAFRECAPELLSAIGAALTRQPLLSLLPAAERAQSAQRARAVWRRAGLAAAACLGLLAGAHVAGLMLSERRASAALTAHAERLARVQAVQRDLGSISDALGMLERESASRARLLALLTGLASSLPDSAFLASIVLEADGMALATGMARNGAGIAAAVERIPGADAAKLDGGLERVEGSDGAWDRFGVRFRYGAGTR